MAEQACLEIFDTWDCGLNYIFGLIPDPNTPRNIADAGLISWSGLSS